MRDPKRIKVILELLEKVWNAYPDYRLSQLISNACFTGGWGTQDIFYCEDDILMNGLKEHEKNILTATFFTKKMKKGGVTK